MKKLVIGAVALVLTTGTAWAQDVRMGTEGAYEPYNFINDQGEVAGFEREVGDLLCEIAGYDCTWVTNDWDTIIPNLLSGNYDTIMAGMSITEERQEKINFTQAYFPPDPSAYAALAGASADAINGNIAAQVNTIQSSYVAESGATLVEYATPDETIAAVRNGEADAVLADKAFLQKIVEEDSQLEFVGDDIMLGSGIGMGLRKSDTEMLEKFNAAIDQIKEDGRLNEFIVKWFGEEKTF